MSYFKNTHHGIIPNNTEYFLERKLLTVHTTDRDKNKYPNANHFSITVPNMFNNVQSMRLIEYSIPLVDYVFSKKKENTKMSFVFYDVSRGNIQRLPKIESSETETFEVISSFETNIKAILNDIREIKKDIELLYSNDNDRTDHTYIHKIHIEIPEGSYTGNELAMTLQNLMNESIFIKTYGNHSIIKGIKPVNCRYNKLEHKFYFGCSVGHLSLHFNIQHSYENCNHANSTIERNSHWGLGFHLGFEKKAYKMKIIDISSTDNTIGPFTSEFTDLSNNTDISNGRTQFLKDLSGLTFTNETEAWLKPLDISSTPLNTKVCFVSSDFPIDIVGEDTIYMEIDQFDTMNEICPYSKNTSSTHNNDLSIRNNGAFAKINLGTTPFQNNHKSKSMFSSNISYYEPPINTLNKMTFKFRYHDGRLVDFKNKNFNFTLEINMIKDNYKRNNVVEVGKTWNI